MVSLVVLWTVPLFGHCIYDMLIPHEIGFLEIGTVVFLLPAIVLGVLCFLRRKQMPRGIGWVMLLTALAALYFAGEFKEYCFALVMLLYLLSVYICVRNNPCLWRISEDEIRQKQ